MRDFLLALALVAAALGELMTGALFVLLVAVFLAAPAFADAGSTLVDFRPLLDQAVQLLAAAVLAVGLWAIRLLQVKLRLDADSQVRTYLDQALKNGIAYSASRLSERIRDMQPVDAKNAIVADAANYALFKVPDALKRFDIDADHLREMIAARLPAVVGETLPHLVAPVAPKP